VPVFQGLLLIIILLESTAKQSLPWGVLTINPCPKMRTKSETQTQSWITLGKSAANLYRRLYDCVMFVVLLLAVLLVVGTAIQNPLVLRKPESGRQTNKLSTKS